MQCFQWYLMNLNTTTTSRFATALPSSTSFPTLALILGMLKAYSWKKFEMFQECFIPPSNASISITSEKLWRVKRKKKLKSTALLLTLISYSIYYINTPKSGLNLYGMEWKSNDIMRCNYRVYNET